jgi:hypothetical protein
VKPGSEGEVARLRVLNKLDRIKVPKSSGVLAEKLQE